MADPFSITTSSFAVLGAADVVLRASVELRRFLSEIKGAPAEIDSLRISIEENTQLVDIMKQHLNDLGNPVSSMSLSASDMTSALEGFKSSVRALDRELNTLRVLAKRYTGSDKTWASVKWVLDERKVSKSLEKLERSKVTLNVALSLVEGFVDLSRACKYFYLC
jgi:chromosome segregation ATPase